MWRGRDADRDRGRRRSTSTRAEVDDLTAAILDGTPPRVDLAFSRGTIATLVELDRVARANAGLSPDAATEEDDRWSREGADQPPRNTTAAPDRRAPLRDRRVAAARRGRAASCVALVAVRPWAQEPACPPIAEHPEWSVARRWDEALLDAIRRALPAPTVHARNLFHTSAAMWDAWAAYDPTASGYFVKEKRSASDVAAARNEAISYAAYRVLSVALHQVGRRPTSRSPSSPTSWTRCATRST